MSKQPKPAYQSLNIISDNSENREDLAFNFNHYASALAEMIATKNNKTPFTMGISGKWGSGKTTLMKAVETKLKNELHDQEKFRKTKTVWFDAWKYKDEDQILAALIEVIIQTIEEDQSFIKEKGKLFIKKIKKTWKRIDWYKFANEIGKATVHIDADKFLNLKEATAVYEDTYKEFLSFYDIFNKHFDALLWDFLEVKKGEDNRAALVVFIDDLDRCPLPKIVQILETIKIFLDKKGCVFVIGAAKDIIQSALAKEEKYNDIEAERFLEKIIQIDFSLPKKQVENATVFIDEIKNQLDIGDELSEEILQIIMPILEFNPRRIIALFNHLKLQEAIMRHSQQNIDFKKMLYWRVLEIYNSRFFKYLIEEPENWDSFIEDKKTYKKLPDAKKNNDEEIEKVITVVKNRDYIKDKKIALLLESSTISKKDYISLVSYTKTFEEATPEFKDNEERTAWIIEQEEIQEQHFRNHPHACKELISIEGGVYNLEGMGEETIQSFKISKYPVCNTWYNEFMEDGGYSFLSTEEQQEIEMRTTSKHWRDSRFNKPYQPVVGISWYEATAFCKWLTRKENKKYRLLTKKEWQAAASGKEPKTYPWGNKWDLIKCNNRELNLERTTAIGIFKEGISDKGIHDMSGNVWEWISNKLDDDSVRYVIQGGSWSNEAEDCRVAFSGNAFRNRGYHDIGFRVALSL